MNISLKRFYKFAEMNPVSWNKNKSLYCIDTSCIGCVNFTSCKIEKNSNLTSEDIKYLKEHSPEYFI